MTILTIYMVPEFIIGVIFALFGIGMIYIMTQLNRDKIDCVVIVLMCFITAAGFIIGSTGRPLPTQQNVIDGTAVYVTDTFDVINSDGEKLIIHNIKWKDEVENEMVRQNN